MQITQSHQDLKEALSGVLRRSYPLVYNRTLTEQYDSLTLPENMTDVLTKEPWIESLPKYQPLEGKLEELKNENWLGEDFCDFVDFLIEQRDNGNRGGIFNPYKHQAKAIKAWAEGKDLVVSTGTGSGKTECFIWPILGHLWNYSRRIESSEDIGPHRGVKAMVLYPMNALVADQLKRMRECFGNIELATQLAGDSLHQAGQKRFYQFGQYTGRTKFFGSYAAPGVYGKRNKKIQRNGSARTYVNKFVAIEDGVSTNPNATDGLYMKMSDKGLIPSKGENLVNDDGSQYSSLREYVNQGDNNTPLLTQPLDRELLMRHEMHNVGYQHLLDGANGDPIITDDNHSGGTPDILITNYSMLEYMLKRPLEHVIWHDTKEWLDENPKNKLLLILDEAHLYQGALGTEVGMLIRRLLHSIGIKDPENKVQIILTSASLGNDVESRTKFTMGLTGRTETWMEQNKTEFITGYPWEIPAEWTNIQIDKEPWMEALGVEKAGDGPLATLDDSSARYALSNNDLCPGNLRTDEDWDTQIELWADWFRATDAYRELYELMSEGVLSLNDLAQQFWGAASPCSIRATERLLNFVATLRTTDPVGRKNFPLLGIRAHLLFRGLPKLYWGIADDTLRMRDGGSSEQVVYPVRGCRICGGPFINVWVHRNEMEWIRAGVNGEAQQRIRTHSRPIVDSVRVEVYLAEEIDGDGGWVTIGNERKRISDQPPHIWVHKYRSTISTRYYPGNAENWVEGDWRPGYLVTDHHGAIRTENDEPEREAFGAQLSKLSFDNGRCPQCNSNHAARTHTLQITDYMTRGDQAFAKLVGALHATQDEDTSESSRGLPNRGKKVLIFSDGRQRASRLAKAVQDASNNDEFRNLIFHLLHDDWYNCFSQHLESSLTGLYSYLVLHLTATNREPFEQTARKGSNPRDIFARNRRTCLAKHIAGLTLLSESGVDLQLGEDDTLLSDMIENSRSAMVEKDRIEALADLFTEGAPTVHEDLNDIRDQYEAETNFRRSINKLAGDSMRFITARILAEVDASYYRLYFGSLLDQCITSCEGNDFRINSDEYYAAITPLVQGEGDGLLEPEVVTHIIDRWNSWVQNPREDYPWSNRRGDVNRHLFRLNTHYELLRVRVIALRDESANPIMAFESKAHLLLNQRYPNLGDISEIAKSIKRTELRVFHDNDRMIKAAILRNMSRLGSLDEQGPDVYYQTIIDFLSSKDFSVNNLGLAHVALVPDVCNRIVASVPFETFDENQLNHLSTALSELIRWPLIAARSQSDRDRNKKWRCLLSTGERFGFRNASKHKAGRYLRRDTWAVPQADLETHYLRLCQEFPDSLLSEFDQQPRIPIASILTELFLPEGEGFYGTNAQKIKLVSVLREEDSGRNLACVRCGRVTSHPYDWHRMTCAHCEHEVELEVYDPTDNLLLQRIEMPWRRPAQIAVDSTDEDLQVTIVRAEEHTAQINDNRDEDEMFTAAEKFELLFQDVPFVVPEEGDRWSLPEAPVDILSCTTTMEVGIDIGSLTAVALRTVPRERANYQQRVGRAGRGKSEVCVALSWYDNVPYAQHYFSNPDDILSHPSTSPIIYLENAEIVKRHIWAAILQTFFKRKRFIREERQFEGMTPDLQNANLMDSMGAIEEFYNQDDDNTGPYSFIALGHWIDGIEFEQEYPDEIEWSNVEGDIFALIPETMRQRELFDQWVNELRDKLDQNRPILSEDEDND